MAGIASVLIVASLSAPQVAQASSAPVTKAPAYAVRLDSTTPLRVQFVLHVPAEETILDSRSASAQPLAPPACGIIPLVSLGAGRWRKPAGCSRVSWAATVLDLDGKAFDASRPRSFWSTRHRLWFLSGDLPWLRYKGEPWAPVHVLAKVRGKSLASETRLPDTTDVPVYILAGMPMEKYAAGPVVTAIYGDIPKGTQYERLRQRVATTLAEWRRNILPNDVRKRTRFNYAWLGGSATDEPGLFASTGSDGILMQFVPDMKDANPYAKLQAGIFLTGAHEGFHALAGSLSDSKPTWVNESWASYFAFAKARHVLTGQALETAKQLFEEPASLSVLHAQAMLNKGDESGYEVFYTRAARFWSAIDGVLTNPPNRNGRLAALVKRTHGMKGVDWDNPGNISAFLDTYTNGRARPIVQCYLVDDRCPTDAIAPP